MADLNYRQNGSWNLSTLRVRQNGQWVAIGGGSSDEDSEVSSRFYTDGPPTRSGDTLDASNYSSLQNAVDALDPNETLFIPASDGPYDERFTIGQNNITIESDGAWISQPDNNENYAIAITGNTSKPEYINETSLVGAHGTGDDVISVGDAGKFSPGDDIYVREDRMPFGIDPGAGGADVTQEYRTVESVDTAADTITVSCPLNFPYPNDNSTEIGRMGWKAEDIRITGLNVQGTMNETSSSQSSRPVNFYGVKDGWFDDMTVEGGGNHCFGLCHSMRCRFNDITFQNALRYGASIFNGTTHTYATNITADNIGRYAVRFGTAASEPSSDGLVEGVSASNFDMYTVNVHHGGFFVDYYDVNTDGTRTMRIRSRELLLDGFTSENCATDVFRTRQVPQHVTIRNGEITNMKGDVIFDFDLRGDEYNEWGEDITFENIEIKDYGPDITDIGRFDARAEIDGLHFIDVMYGETRLAREHVEKWEGYDLADVTNMTFK